MTNLIAILMVTLTTNWVFDPLDPKQELGIIYSNTLAQVIWNNTTNEIKLQSVPVGVAGTRPVELKFSTEQSTNTFLYLKRINPYTRDQLGRPPVEDHGVWPVDVPINK